MIAIYNLENQYFNLALEKVKKFYIDNGEEVVDYVPLLHNTYEKIYASSIFNFTDKQYLTSDMITGGTGINLETKLPEEIERIKIKQNKGFTMRGCIRNCSFCVVPKKEGIARPVGDIYDIWDGVSKEIILYDNNILALPDHFKLICSQLKKEKLKVDWNQGLDFRLLTKENIKLLFSLKHIAEIRFAFDYIEYTPLVIKALDLLRQMGLKDWKTRWYVYVGEKDTFDTVYNRMKLLREYKQGVYVMRDNKVYDKPEFIALSGWGNTMGAFKFELKEALKRSERMKPYIKYFPKRFILTLPLK